MLFNKTRNLTMTVMGGTIYYQIKKYFQLHHEKIQLTGKMPVSFFIYTNTLTRRASHVEEN